MINNEKNSKDWKKFLEALTFDIDYKIIRNLKDLDIGLNGVKKPRGRKDRKDKENKEETSSIST